MSRAMQAEAKLVHELEEFLGKPVYFKDVLARFSQHEYRAILVAWSEIRNRFELGRDENGRYWIESPMASS